MLSRHAQSKNLLCSSVQTEGRCLKISGGILTGAWVFWTHTDLLGRQTSMHTQHTVTRNSYSPLQASPINKSKYNLENSPPEILHQGVRNTALTGGCGFWVTQRAVQGHGEMWGNTKVGTCSASTPTVSACFETALPYRLHLAKAAFAHDSKPWEARNICLISFHREKKEEGKERRGFPKLCNASVGRRLWLCETKASTWQNQLIVPCAEAPAIRWACFSSVINGMTFPEFLLHGVLLSAPEAISLSTRSRAGGEIYQFKRRDDLLLCKHFVFLGRSAALRDGMGERRLSRRVYQHEAHSAVCVSEWNMLPNIS